MDVREAQREVRKTFRGGFMGQLVSGVLWLGSAALATWGTPRQAILLLVVGGFFIFPRERSTGAVETVARACVVPHRGSCRCHGKRRREEGRCRIGS